MRISFTPHARKQQTAHKKPYIRLYMTLGCLLMLAGIPAPAFAVCHTPSGVEGEIIFNRDWKAMQFCDGDKWISMGGAAAPDTNWQAEAAGDNGQIQFNDNGVLGASSRLYWQSNNSLNIQAAGGARIRVFSDDSGAPARRSILTLESGDITAGRALGIITKNATQENWFIGEGYGATGAFTIGYGATQPEYAAQSKITISPAGDVGINKSSPTEKLDVNGNIAISAGNNLIMDIVHAYINVSVNPPEVVQKTGSGTVSCTHSEWPNPSRTDCFCPSGYKVISGGGYAGQLGTALRINTALSDFTTWRVACVTHDANRVACANASIICARVTPNN